MVGGKFEIDWKSYLISLAFPGVIASGGNG